MFAKKQTLIEFKENEIKFFENFVFFLCFCTRARVLPRYARLPQRTELKKNLVVQNYVGVISYLHNFVLRCLQKIILTFFKKVVDSTPPPSDPGKKYALGNRVKLK